MKIIKIEDNNYELQIYLNVIKSSLLYKKNHSIYFQNSIS